MYDTVNIWTPYEQAGFQTVTSLLPDYLQQVSTTTNQQTGITTLSGSLNGMRFNIKPSGLQITGSICKFHFGNNQKTLTIQDVEAVVQVLTELTGLPMGSASVYRLDFAENFIVTQPENRYYEFLGESRYYKRLEQNNGLYYQCNRRTLLFYGKVHEQRTVSRVPILPEFEGKHVLRYEMRLKNRLAKQMDVPEVKLSMLYDPVFYCSLLERYRLEYRSIMKRNMLEVGSGVPVDKDVLLNQMMLLGGFYMGGESRLLKIVDVMQRRGEFENPMQAVRLKDKIKRIFRAQDLTGPSELIDELTDKIERRVEAELRLFS